MFLVCVEQKDVALKTDVLKAFSIDLAATKQLPVLTANSANSSYREKFPFIALYVCMTVSCWTAAGSNLKIVNVA